MKKNNKRYSSSGKGSFAWGVVIALLIVLVSLLFGIFYFFQDRTSAKLSILYSDRDQLVASLGTALAEKESISIKYEQGLISLDEQKSLNAIQNALITEYQQKIEQQEIKINNILGKNIFSEDEKLFLASMSSLYKFSTSINAASFVNMPEFVKGPMLVSNNVILDSVLDTDIISFFSEHKSTAANNKFVYNSNTYSTTNYNSTDISFYLKNPPNFVDTNAGRYSLLEVIDNNDGTYSLCDSVYSTVQFYIPNNIVNYENEEVAFILLGEKYYIHSFDLYMTTGSFKGYVILNAKTADGNGVILHFMFTSNYDLTFVLYREDVNQFYSCNFVKTSYIPEDFFDKV